MTALARLGIGVLLCIPAASCGGDNSQVAKYVLLPPDSALCEHMRKFQTQFLYLDKDPETIFRLNTAPYDSIKLDTFVRVHLRQFQAEYRLIGVGSALANDTQALHWLLPLVDSAGARAVAVTPECAPPPIPDAVAASSKR